MTKCDFCTMSYPNGKCYWSSRVAAEDDCEKAIKRMIKAYKVKKKITRKRDGFESTLLMINWRKI